MRKHTRREVLKRGALATGSGAFYGTIGGLAGKAYDVIGRALGLITDTARQGVEITGKKLYEVDRRVEESERPVVKNVVRPVKRVEDWRIKGFRKLFGVGDEDVEENRESLGIPHSKGYKPKPQEEPEEEKVSRRNLLQYILSLGNRYPVQAGIIGGASYGVAKSVLGGRKNFQIARLQDQADELKEQNGALAKSQREYSEQLGKLERGVRQEPLTSEEVDKRISEGEDLYFFVGGIGLLAVIFFSLTNITGNAILDLNKTQFNIFNILIFFISLIIIHIGARFK